MNALDVGLVLVAVDGSEESTRAVEYGVAVADAYDAAVHVVAVLEDEGEREAAASATGTGQPDAAASAAGDDADEEAVEYAETAREIAADRGVDVSTSVATGFSTDRLRQHPGSVVLDTAEEKGADFLVVPRERSGERTKLLEKTAEYALRYASQPVLSV